jgi:hypothetical protein
MRGEPDRAGAIHRTKHLHMYRWEASSRAGRPVPATPPPPEVEMRWLQAAEWERTPSLLPRPAPIVSRRFADGGRCLIIHQRDSGELVYHVWLSTAGAWTDWIGARVVPPTGYALVFDLWAHPEWRTGRLHIPGATEVARSADDLGVRGMVAGVEEQEVVPSARMYARAGLGYIAPYEVVVWHRLGPLSWHRRVPPTEQLVERCAQIRRRYEEP